MYNISVPLKLFLVFLGCFFCSCEQKATHSFTVNDVFRYNESSDIKTLDPAYASNQAHIWVCNQLYNSLVQMDSVLNIKPAIAKSWSIDSTATVYTFTLNTDIQFYDPQNTYTSTLTASDVVFSLERLRSKALAAPGAWILESVKENGIHVITDSQVEIELKEPNPAFLSLLSMQYASILSETYYKDVKENYFKSPISTGPFYFKFWEDKVKLVLRKNPLYFEKDAVGKPLPYLEAVSIRFLPDKHAAFLEFVKGNLDFISGIDASYKDEVLDKEGRLKNSYKGKINLMKQDYLNTEYLAFLVDSTSFYPYTNADFRKAVNFAFDRTLMMKYIRNGIGTPAENGFIPKGLQAFDNQNKFTFYNKDSVEYYLNQSHYIKQGSPEIELHTNNSYLDLCEYIQNSLNGFGIKTKVTVHPSSTLRQMISKQKVQFFRASWIADYPDAENYLSLFYSENKAPNGPNYSHFSNSTFDSLYIQARAIGVHKDRIGVYRTMQNMMMEESPVVPLYYDEVYVFTQKYVEGLQTNPMNLIHIKHIKKEVE